MAKTIAETFAERFSAAPGPQVTGQLLADILMTADERVEEEDDTRVHDGVDFYFKRAHFEDDSFLVFLPDAPGDGDNEGWHVSAIAEVGSEAEDDGTDEEEDSEPDEPTGASTPDGTKI